MIDYAAAAGLPRPRMIATGSPSDDAMFHILKNASANRAALFSELGMHSNRQEVANSAFRPIFFT